MCELDTHPPFLIQAIRNRVFSISARAGKDMSSYTWLSLSSGIDFELFWLELRLCNQSRAPGKEVGVCLSRLCWVVDYQCPILSRTKDSSCHIKATAAQRNLKQFVSMAISSRPIQEPFTFAQAF